MTTMAGPPHLSIVEAPPANPDSEVWADHAEELTAWALARLVNRDDAYGGYEWDAKAGAFEQTSRQRIKFPRSWTEPKDAIARHFTATSGRDVIGQYTTAPDHTSRWMGFDIDAKTDKANPALNLRTAIAIQQWLKARGFTAYIFDTNGKGGLHVFVFMQSPAPTARIFALMIQAINSPEVVEARTNAEGQLLSVETYPKQRDLSRCPLGNWLRMPGRHYKRDHWARLWTGDEWASAAETVESILAIDGDDWTDKLPAADVLVLDPAKFPEVPGAGPDTTVKKRRAGDLGAMMQGIAYIKRIDGSKVLEGKRDETIYKVACYLTRDLAMDDIEARPLLIRLNESFPVPHPISKIDEKLKTARQYSQNGQGCKLNASSCEPPPATAEDPAESQDDANTTTITVGESHARKHREMTDVGNAERLVDRHGKDIRYCEALGWLVWDGQRWKRDDNGAMTRRMMDTAKSIYREAANEHDADRAKALGKHAAKTQSKYQIDAAIGLARSMLPVVIKPDAFDADPMLLNVANGIVDLRTGELRPHSREAMLTRLAPCEYSPEAHSPTLMTFLARIMPDIDMRAFLKRAMGYTITGSANERCMFIPWGNGNNGKSTFINLIRETLGDYAMQTHTETLMQRKGDAGINNDVARLHGARMVAASEGEDGQRLAEAKIKQLTGGTDAVSARFLYRESFDYVPTFKLWLGTNHKPIITGTDNAIWNRIKLIPFTTTIPDEEIDTDLPDKLRAELPGALTWAVEGCLDWQLQGLRTPEKVTEATAKYRADSDLLGVFIDAYCEVGGSYSEGARTLYEGYIAYCKASGLNHFSEVRFARAMEDRRFTKDKGRSVAMWLGLQLTVEARNVVETERMRRERWGGNFGAA